MNLLQINKRVQKNLNLRDPILQCMEKELDGRALDLFTKYDVVSVQLVPLSPLPLPLTMYSPTQFPLFLFLFFSHYHFKSF